jgi:acyl carrier protein
MKEKIEEIVFSQTKEFFDNSDYQLTMLIDKNMRLIGDSSPLDSIGLVSLIVEVEESINEYFDTELVLASEKAMSAKTSPFINLGTLIRYIEDELNIIDNE